MVCPTYRQLFDFDFVKDFEDLYMGQDILCMYMAARVDDDRD